MNEMKRFTWGVKDFGEGFTWQISVFPSIELDTETAKGPVLVGFGGAFNEILIFMTKTERRWIVRKNGSTHGVSSMTRHTHAMVLRQSVVSSMGKVLFWGKEDEKGKS